MAHPRLEIAFPGPPEGRLLALNAPADLPLELFGQVTAVQGHYPDHSALAARGTEVHPDLPATRADLALIAIPRAKAAARALIAAAAMRAR